MSAAREFSLHERNPNRSGQSDIKLLGGEGALARRRSAQVLAGIALTAILYLLYSPSFLTDYLMKDEWAAIGTRDGLRGSAIDSFFFWGRALFGIYATLVYRFVGYHTFRIQIVRFVNFASFAIIALLLFELLRRWTGKLVFSLLVLLLFFSQPCIQGPMAYSLQMISNVQPAAWLSLLALYAGFYATSLHSRKYLRWAIIFALLSTAMQSTQTYAFFCMVPLTYLTLFDWKRHRQKVLEFTVVASVVLVFWSFVYTLGLQYAHHRGWHGYRLGEEAVSALGHNPLSVMGHALNPVEYWSAFELWGYPFPFQHTPPLGAAKMFMALTLMLAWILLVCWTVVLELRTQVHPERPDVWLKWGTVLAYLGLNATFIVADSPLAVVEHRPHTVLCFSGILIFSSAYCLRVLASRYAVFNRPWLQAAAIGWVAFVVLGSQSAFLRGYVENRRDEIDFIRAELNVVDPSDYRDVLVVLPDWSGCTTEPCDPWAGHIVEDRRHLTQLGVYRYALASLGVAPESKSIHFVDRRPERMAAGSVLLDWDKYVSLQRR